MPTPSVHATSANATPEADGAVKVSLGDVALQIDRCASTPVSPTITHCDGDTYIRVTRDDKTQSVMVTSLYIDRNATFYRGPLDASYKQNGHSIVMTDVDGDGLEDLILWTGKEGAYGGPSYDVLLMSKEDGQYYASPGLSELTVGANGLFSIENGRLTLTSSDGCCIHVFDTYELNDGEPTLVERRTEETKEGTADVNVKTERLVNGTLQTVK